MHFIVHVITWYARSVGEGNFLVTLRWALFGAMIGMAAGFALAFGVDSVELKPACIGLGILGAVVAAPFGAGIRVSPRKGWKPVGQHRKRAKPE